MFTEAIKEQSKLRLALYGPSGSGKSLTALVIATAIGEKVGVIDSEHDSAKKYADRFRFQHASLGSHHPDAYIEAFMAAADAGFDALIVDSASHAWMGHNGILELVDHFTEEARSSSSFGSGWNKVRPIESRFWDRLLSLDMHVIVTLRAKTQYATEEEDSGGRRRTRIRKLGLGPIQRDNIEYEFDVVGQMDLDNVLTIESSRYEQLPPGLRVEKPDAAFAVLVQEALAAGEPPAPPEAAAEKDVDELRGLLKELGKDDQFVERVLADKRATSRGVLPPEWVAKEIRRATEAVAARTPKPTPEPEPEPEPEKPEGEPEPEKQETLA